jgi:glycosyltransferase involved in cell wall biosynthesis
VAFELSQALQTRYKGTNLVRFVRYDPLRDSFWTVDWSEIAGVFNGLTEPESPPNRHVPGNAASRPAAEQFVRKLVYRLPGPLHIHVTDVLVAQRHALHAWGRFFGALARGVTHAPRWFAQWRNRGTSSAERPDVSDSPNLATGAAFATQVAPGDTLLTLGAFWSHPDYAALIEKHRKRLGLRYALVVYDIIPLRHPEWCDRSFVTFFRAFFDSVVPLCDTILAISRATAADVVDYARERDIRLSAPVVPIPMGSGFGVASLATMVPRTDQLPPAGGYALFVSTIEARKNHLLLFRVWQRLLEELPPDQVPALVFAGRVGRLVDDLMQQIANTNYLDGKLMVIENPSDSELVALYQGCRFTLFPSFHEGWGLPVTESLAFGKPCLIADRTSLPEAGGSLTRRFDPDNLHDAYAAIRAVIIDPDDLKRWAETVRREFRPVPWTESAEALFEALEGSGAANADAVHPGGMTTEIANTA